MARALQEVFTRKKAMNQGGISIKHEAFALAQAGFGFVLLGLVLLGIGGTIYKIISPEGWVAQAFGRSLSAGAAALGSLVMIVALAWFSRGHASPKRSTRLSDVAVYGFAAAGLVYLSQLWTKGSF
jgi:drug/metabolite transporter (DMT)-like permease